MATIAEMISRTEKDLADARTLRSSADIERSNILSGKPDDYSLTAEENAKFRALTDDIAARGTAIEGLESTLNNLRKEAAADEAATRAAEESKPAARTAPATIGNEKRTYNKGNQTEFMRDLLGFSFNGLDNAGRERLERHAQEARVEGQYSERAASTSTFQGIIPPQYLIDQYALVARAGRPIANTVQHLTLPKDGMSLIIPRSTTGVTTAIQASENAALSTTDQVWANVTVPVVTIGAYNDISRQSLDRAEGVDQIVFNDALAAYAVNLDQQVISGSGTGGQMLGILNTSGVNQASAFTAAATPTTFYNKGAGQLSAIETTRFLAADIIYMHPRRWNWLLAQVDSQGRPLVVPNVNGPYNGLGITDTPQDTPATQPVGWLYGLPVITDASLPTSVGTGPEDQVIIARKEDLLLWEEDAAPFQLRFDQTVGTNLTVRLVVYGYAAFTAGRFPTAVGIVGGNAGTAGFGLIAPTF